MAENIFIELGLGRFFDFSLTVDFKRKIANDAIQTTDFWFRKQPLYQQRHNRCNFVKVKGRVVWLSGQLDHLEAKDSLVLVLVPKISLKGLPSRVTT